MKKVIPFLDMYDEIPDNAKYLFSRTVEIPSEETEEQKTARLISNNQEQIVNAPTVIYVHYYEVDGMDFDEMIDKKFGEKTPADKIQEFVKKYKIQTK